MPWTLRKAVIEKYGTDAEDLTDEEVQRNVELRLRLAAHFIRGIFDDETGEWEAVTLTFEEMTGELPGDDIEALDTFVYMANETSPQSAALLVNATSEVVLGLIDTPPPTEPQEEAGDTVDGWSEFRDEPGSGDADAERGDVAPTPIGAARNRKPADRVSGGRRARTPAAPREAAG